MHLCTMYAPGSFLKPCLVVDTVYTSTTKETAIKFVEALNVDHVWDRVYWANYINHDPLKSSGWIIIQRHDTRLEAVAYHLDLTKHFHNSGSEDEWQEGWEPYLAIYNQWCPEEIREKHFDQT